MYMFFPVWCFLVLMLKYAVVVQSIVAPVQKGQKSQMVAEGAPGPSGSYRVLLLFLFWGAAIIPFSAPHLTLLHE